VECEKRYAKIKRRKQTMKRLTISLLVMVIALMTGIVTQPIFAADINRSKTPGVEGQHNPDEPGTGAGLDLVKGISGAEATEIWSANKAELSAAQLAVVAGAMDDEVMGQEGGREKAIITEMIQNARVTDADQVTTNAGEKSDMIVAKTPNGKYALVIGKNLLAKLMAASERKSEGMPKGAVTREFRSAVCSHEVLEVLIREEAAAKKQTISDEEVHAIATRRSLEGELRAHAAQGQVLRATDLSPVNPQQLPVVLVAKNAAQAQAVGELAKKCGVQVAEQGKIGKMPQGTAFINLSGQAEEALVDQISKLGGFIAPVSSELANEDAIRAAILVARYVQAVATGKTAEQKKEDLKDLRELYQALDMLPQAFAGLNAVQIESKLDSIISQIANPAVNAADKVALLQQLALPVAKVVVIDFVANLTRAMKVLGKK
jgi:hypothetical protein